MKQLSEKDVKAVNAMIHQARKFSNLNNSYIELASAGELVLSQFEDYLRLSHSLKIEDNHIFRFFGAQIQSSLEASLGMDNILASMTVYHLFHEDGVLRKIKIVSISFDRMGNTPYNDTLPEFITGSIINYFQFTSQIALPLTKN